MLVATEDGHIDLDGIPHHIRRGVTRVRANHPLVKKAPNLWKPIEMTYDVEQTTAAPGEKRGEAA